MSKATKIYNDYELDMILKSDKTDFNNFYKPELVRMLELSKKEQIKDIHEFQDMMISSLRYALGRKTYITGETAEFIMDYPEIIDERVCVVMLRDISWYVAGRNNNVFKDDFCDYETWINLQNWLFDLAKKKGLDVIGYERR